MIKGPVWGIDGSMIVQLCSSTAVLILVITTLHQVLIQRFYLQMGRWEVTLLVIRGFEKCHYYRLRDVKKVVQFFTCQAFGVQPSFLLATCRRSLLYSVVMSNGGPVLSVGMASALTLTLKNGQICRIKSIFSRTLALLFFFIWKLLPCRSAG